jgi:glycerate kinase
MASASGLTLVPPEKRNPMLTTTYGTGELIKDALQRGCRRFLVGIGGSATNDAGTGMLQALGFRFFDSNGNELDKGGQILEQIAHIDSEKAIPALQESVFTIACDVNNPFSGENGAAFVYARQKGADDAMIHQLDKGLKQFAAVISASIGKDIDTIPGAGAAGGLGGGFLAFLPATLKPGIKMVLEALDFDNRIQNADLIITGEGKLDRQTGMGKTPAGVLNAGKRQQIPVIAIGGAVEETNELLQQGFLAVLSIQPGPVSLEQAMDKSFAYEQIKRIVEQIIRLRI